MTAAQQRAFGRMKKNVLVIGVLVAVVVISFVVMQVVGATSPARTVVVTDGEGNTYALSCRRTPSRPSPRAWEPTW